MEKMSEERGKSYDENGNLVKEIIYDSDGNANQILTYEYNEDGTVSSTTTVDHDSNIKYENDYTYNEEGQITREYQEMDDFSTNKLYQIVDKEYDNDAGTYKAHIDDYEYNEDGSLRGVNSWNTEGVGGPTLNMRGNPYVKAESELEKNKEDSLDVQNKSNDDSFGQKIVEKFKHTINEIRDGINPILSEIKEIIQEIKDIQKEKSIEKEEQGRSRFN